MASSSQNPTIESSIVDENPTASSSQNPTIESSIVDENPTPSSSQFLTSDSSIFAEDPTVCPLQTPPLYIPITDRLADPLSNRMERQQICACFGLSESVDFYFPRFTGPASPDRNAGAGPSNRLKSLIGTDPKQFRRRAPPEINADAGPFNRLMSQRSTDVSELSQGLGSLEITPETNRLRRDRERRMRLERLRGIDSVEPPEIHSNPIMPNGMRSQEIRERTELPQGMEPPEIHTNPISPHGSIQIRTDERPSHSMRSLHTRVGAKLSQYARRRTIRYLMHYQKKFMAALSELKKYSLQCPRLPLTERMDLDHLQEGLDDLFSDCHILRLRLELMLQDVQKKLYFFKKDLPHSFKA